VSPSFRVGFDATQLPRLGAGTATYILNLVAELAALPDRDFDLVVVAKDIDADALRAAAPSATVVAVRLPTRPYRLAWEQVGLPLLMRRAKIVVLHSPHYTVPFTGAFRRVVTFHDLTYITMPERHSQSRRWYFRLAIPRAARRADSILCDSAQTREDLHHLYPDLPLDRSTVVPLGITPRYFESIPPDSVRRVKEQYRLPEHYVLHVGTIEPRKNIQTALRAVELLRMSGHPTALVLVGPPGWESRELYSALQRSPICRALGHIPLEDLVAVYAGARSLVMPSHYEGFGFPVLEAMAVGVPVVCSGKGSLREVAGDAALIPASDAPEDYAAVLQTASETGPDREAIIRRGQQWASQYTWRRTAAQTASVYRRLAREALDSQGTKGSSPPRDARGQSRAE
jgi:glycosyltransferase involved in cell wall biosynthesis